MTRKILKKPRAGILPIFVISTISMSYQTIITELSEQIFTITINRPEKLNALNRQVIDELVAAIEEIYNNPEIRGAILTGSGPKSFVAGADISEFIHLDAQSGKALSKKGQDLVFDRIENSPKPIIAAVNGFALGGGCELAMACHFRLASENAKFGQPEVNLGLVPGYGGTQRLTQLVGKGKSMELTLTGSLIDADEALKLRLVNHVTAPENLIPETRKILLTIISKAPIAIAEAIALVNHAAFGKPGGLEKEIESFGKLSGTADAKEGANAFLEKRKANFRGN
jgi:enoyl-CoA hydratase